MPDRLEAICAGIVAPDAAVGRLSRVRQLARARPAGSLGGLDELVHRIAAMRGETNVGPLPAVVSVLAGDHGVAVHGTSAFAPGVSAAVLRLIASGGAPVGILTRRAGATLRYADVGLHEDVGDLTYKVARGTGDISRADAMSIEQALQAIGNGIDYARTFLDTHALVAVGEVGLGNTTVATALAARLLDRPVAELVGPGSGVPAPTQARKQELVTAAMRRCAAPAGNPVDVLAGLGGLEIAGNVGVILAAAHARSVVLLDGYISGVAALLAVRLCPAVGGYLVAAHRSREPGHRYVLAALGLDPLLDLGMFLGTGAGAALAIPLVNSALAVATLTPSAGRVGLAGVRASGNPVEPAVAP